MKRDEFIESLKKFPEDAEVIVLNDDGSEYRYADLMELQGSDGRSYIVVVEE